MSIKDGLSEQGREYLSLWCNDEMEQLKWRIDVEKQAAKQEAIDHERLMRESAREVLCLKIFPATDSGSNIEIKDMAATNNALPSLLAPSNKQTCKFLSPLFSLLGFPPNLSWDFAIGCDFVIL